ncbi:hypothetical protein [Bradyrhizobium septentrionale]|uniref:Uncharacterized protein n=1 Tax=Bradyrhizobium septentrionale TaxID=1404411 RepID=A0A973W471_9BRAD|nr:hypothetical protein [Bradyrhizobium septentrionale]UGY15677.1 hypothetical protein HAP48_0045440 [Bradyrhizobium septentrionale]UGY24252.1 hypothetical protein HU675_0041075 [Bradyrhizobium septentrionale]
MPKPGFCGLVDVRKGEFHAQIIRHRRVSDNRHSADAAVTVAQNTGSGSPSSASPASLQVTSPPPGTNRAGTAQSSGRLNGGEGVTTASTESIDKAIADENRMVDRRMNSICGGC